MISGICCFWDSICASGNIEVTALFEGSTVFYYFFFSSIKMGNLPHPPGDAGSQIKSLQYILFALSATAAANQFIVSASQNGCWSSNKQHCKINEGEHIVISISIMESVSGLKMERRGERRDRATERKAKAEDKKIR